MTEVTEHRPMRVVTRERKRLAAMRAELADMERRAAELRGEIASLGRRLEEEN